MLPESAPVLGEHRWRLLVDGSQDGASNMAIDEAIMQAHARGEVPPTLRFYAWDPPAVSIGYFQSMEREVNLAACRRLGIDAVRRPTGGRAILHDRAERELTYSVVIRQELLPGGVVETYRALSAGLLAGLQLLGLAPEVAAEKAMPGGESSAACFDAPSLYELVVKGRKIVGSAQTRQGGAILQHGTILLQLDAELLFTALQAPPGARQRLVEYFRKRATSVTDALGRPVDWAEAQAAFARGFAQALGLHLTRGELTEAEVQAAAEIRQQKYADDSWNLRR